MNWMLITIIAVIAVLGAGVVHTRARAAQTEKALQGTREAAQVVAGGDEAQIRAIEDRIMAAFAAGDADALAANYTEDAVLMTMDRPSITGRKNIADHYRRMLQNVTTRLTTHIEEVQVGGDWGFMRGRFEQTITMKQNGASMSVKGKYIAVVRRDKDGVWRFARDIFNLDAPVAPPPEPSTRDTGR